MKNNSKETDRVKEPSKFAIKFANTVFMLGILFSVLVAVYAVYNIYNLPESFTSTFYYLCLLFAVLTASLLGIGLKKLRDELKMNMSVLFITVGISVYGFETYLEFFHEDPQSRKAIAEKMGVPFDTRTYIEVFEDLINSGINAYANVNPMPFVESNGFNTSKGKIFPLGGISNINTIGGNESGYYPIFETDEHGFNNSKGLYQINKVDIVLIGDSFTEGGNVHLDETISAVLRELGFNSISVGKGGNGPLLELASLKEYAEPLKPKIILWLYFVNDIDDLTDEIMSPFLLKYINKDNFSQNLISRQEEIDSLLVGYVEDQWEREREKERESEMARAIITEIILIRNLRKRLNLKPTPTPRPTPPTHIFKDIMQKANHMVSGWGGKMYFVYLPSYYSFVASSSGLDVRESFIYANEELNREFVLNIATELEIPIIDIHREVFVPHSDPLSLYPFRMPVHWTAEGYKLVAESISKRLKADGIIPLNFRN